MMATKGGKAQQSHHMRTDSSMKRQNKLLKITTIATIKEEDPLDLEENNNQLIQPDQFDEDLGYGMGAGMQNYEDMGAADFQEAPNLDDRSKSKYMGRRSENPWKLKQQL